MIKTIKLLCGFMAIATMAFVASCADDSPNIGGGGSVKVADGFYITKVDIIPVASSQLVAEKVEADDFSTQDRAGFLASYVFLTAGDYNVVSVIDQEIAQTLGGTAVTETNDTEAFPDGTGSDCGLHAYTLVEEFAVDGPAFNVTTDGLYKVSMDNETKEFVLYKIEKAQLIGAASPAGWSSSENQDMLVDGTVTATSATFKLTGVTMRPGEFKVRFNCRWQVDRRIDLNLGWVPTNGYGAFTNFGGTLAALTFGGANFPIALGEDGIYNITATWTAASGFSITVIKTSSIDPIVFDPGDYVWGIIGDGSPVGNWDSDIDLTYDGIGANGHSWSGTYALTTAGFKFRTNDSWDFAPNANTYSAVTGDGAGDIDATGNDFLPTVAGTHLITISTNDAGVTWAVDFDKQ